jgi:hypothetical protein
MHLASRALVPASSPSSDDWAGELLVRESCVFHSTRGVTTRPRVWFSQ